MIRSNSSLLIAAIFWTSLPVAAAGRDLGKELASADALLQAQDFDRAFQEYSQYTRHNPLAQFNLGLIEQHGWGRPANPVAACRWFEGASAGNIPMAQQMLADCYRLGVHAPANFSLAENWYRRAADNGLPTANYWWGRMLIDAKFGRQDLRQGISLCELAAQAGATQAQLYLANMYRSGEVFEKNDNRALYWYERAAQGNNAEALYHLGILMRDNILENSTREAALHALERAAAQGYEPAYLPTAELFFQTPVESDSDMPTAHNLAKSYLWLRAVLITSEGVEERARAQEMLDVVNGVMPQTWVKDLDTELDAHFARINGKGPELP